MKLSNQQPKPALMRTYYEKLAQVSPKAQCLLHRTQLSFSLVLLMQIFWASENYLFHAYSLSRFQQLQVHSSSHACISTQS
jgi:hypothetical protein